MSGCAMQESSHYNNEELKTNSEQQEDTCPDEETIYVDGFDEPMTEDEFNDIVDETEEQIEELPEETQIFINSLISGEVYELYDIDKTFTDEEIEKMIFLALNGDDVEFILGEYE